MPSLRPPAQLSNGVGLLRISPRLSASPYPSRTTGRRFKSTKGVPKKETAPANKPPVERSFKGQLYDSTYQRLQRERAEQARFATMRAGQEPRIAEKWFPIVFGALVIGSLSYYLGRLNSPPEASTTSTTPLSSSPGPRHDTRESVLQAAWTDFRDIVGEEHVITDVGDLEAHAGSSWSSHPQLPEDVPFLIVKPLTTEDVSKIMKVCHDRRIPVTPYSGGTSLEGHFAATRGGICIDFSRMDQIVKLNKEDLDVVVQPAVGWQFLNEELAEVGLFFPPDPGPGAMIGGMVATGCSGTNSYRYGTMKDWVLSLTVVLADGTIIKTRQRPRKSSAGYDLTRLFVGSEGTLGLITEAVLKVTPKPQQESVAVCTFNTVREAADCVFRVVGAGVPIAAIEILDDVQMSCINEAGMTSRQWKEAQTLFFKFTGTPSGVKENIAQVQKLAKSAGSKTFEFARSKEEADELWSARKEALWSTMSRKKHDGERVWTTDVAVPISKLADIIEITKDDIKDSGLMGSIVGHVGDGNFHSILLYDPEIQEEREKVEGLVHRMVRRAIEMEGTATGEHGIGLVKRDYLEKELGVGTVDLMRKLKLAVDPLGLLNCDKVVRVEKSKKGERIEEW
ncbi:FAD-binding domain-containing protein [Tothia fuscella]|uniref:D-lactate dehydrogenase (cytochrome) n=1 Tax=Tothia fuscella TaxID=1048955 RepID=A0A9P4P274_9PEZI|nr:FAD-binding domain-containing protein [Tothia fuscella]